MRMNYFIKEGDVVGVITFPKGGGSENVNI